MLSQPLNCWRDIAAVVSNQRSSTRSENKRSMISPHWSSYACWVSGIGPLLRGRGARRARVGRDPEPHPPLHERFEPIGHQLDPSLRELLDQVRVDDPDGAKEEPKNDSLE